jgi:hypothetical protein
VAPPPVSGCVHLGQRNGPTIWIGDNYESSPGGLLGRPENRNSGPSGLVLPGVGVLHVEAHRCCPSGRACREDASLVMTPVVSMQHDSSRRSADNDNDVIFETDRKAECLDVERPGFAQVPDKQNEAVEVVNLHVSMLATVNRRSVLRGSLTLA